MISPTKVESASGVIVPAATFTAGGRGTGYAVVDADWATVSMPTTYLTKNLAYTLTMTSTGEPT